MWLPFILGSLTADVILKMFFAEVERLCLTALDFSQVIHGRFVTDFAFFHSKRFIKSQFNVGIPVQELEKSVPILYKPVVRLNLESELE